MSIVLPALDSFTVILIGGTATLIDGGPEVDIRAEHRHDPASVVTNAIAANSLRWWETATSLVRPMVAATNHLTQASIFGKRTVTTATPAGDTKRTRLSSLLDGGVAAVKDETVAKPFTDADWLLSDYKQHNIRQQNPALRSQLFVSTDASVFTIPYEGANLFYQFESFVSDGSVLIVPHTRLAERFLNAYAEKQNLGREPDTKPFLRTDTDVRDDLAKAHPPVVADSNFQVTGLFAANNWQNPRPLEAARQLKVSRYDMKAGLWDLVNDDVLRETMLDEQPLPPATSEIVNLPEKYLNSARPKLSEQSQQRLTAKEKREVELDEIHNILREAGWKTQAGFKDKYTYQILPTADLRFDLYINKASAAAYLATSSQTLIDEVVNACKQAVPTLKNLYVDSEHSELADDQAIWRAHGEEELIDLALRAADLRPQWETVFADLIGQAPSMFASEPPAPTPHETGSDATTVELDDVFPGLTADITQITDKINATLDQVRQHLDEVGSISNRSDADLAINRLESARQTFTTRRSENQTLRQRIETSSLPADLKSQAVEPMNMLDQTIDQLDAQLQRQVGDVKKATLALPPPPPRAGQRPNPANPPPPETPPPPQPHQTEVTALRRELHQLVKVTQSAADQVGTLRDTATALKLDEALKQAEEKLKASLRPRAIKLEKKHRRRWKQLPVGEQERLQNQYSSLMDDIDEFERNLEKKRALAAVFPTKDRLFEIAAQQKEAGIHIQRQMIELGTISNRRMAKKGVALLEAAKAQAVARYVALDDLRKSIHPEMPKAPASIAAAERLLKAEQGSISNFNREIKKVSRLL